MKKWIIGVATFCGLFLGAHWYDGLTPAKAPIVTLDVPDPRLDLEHEKAQERAPKPVEHLTVEPPAPPMVIPEPPAVVHVPATPEPPKAFVPPSTAVMKPAKKVSGVQHARPVEPASVPQPTQKPTTHLWCVFYLPCVD